MIAALRRARSWLERPDPSSSELSEMRDRVAGMRSEVQALQICADVLYGQPQDDAWRDLEAVARG